MAKKKPADAWFQNEFSGFDFSTTTESKKRKTKSKQAVAERSGAELPLAQAYEPKSEADLVVHKKKVTEARQFLEAALSSPIAGSAPILFLTGPSGSGKTTLIKVLCHGLGCSICEWINPTYDAATETSGILTTFKEFLFRSGRYPQLNFGSSPQQKIVLVEDIPNIFLMPSFASSFLDIIEEYRCRGAVPLVVILLDSVEYNRLLPRRSIDAGLVTHISLNPVATSFILKCLSKVAAAESTKLRRPAPSADELEAMANSSNGDVRSALNALSFRMLRTARTRQAETDSSSATRDIPLDLFHALGKVLMGKPSVTDRGGKPVFTPLEDIAAASGMSQERFALFLHENYHDFFTDLDDLETAADYFSAADVLSSYWQGGTALAEYASATACRGVACANRHPAPSRWRPLHRPAYNEVFAQADTTWGNLAAVFFDPSGSQPLLPALANQSTLDLKLDIFPTLSRIRPRSLSAMQALNLIPLTRWRAGWPSRRISVTAAPAVESDEEDAAPCAVAPAISGSEHGAGPAALPAAAATTTLSPLVEDVELFDSD